MSTVDILSYMLPNQVWAMSNYLAMAGTTPGTTGQPLHPYVQGNQIWEMKGNGGYPWDSFTFDSNYLYQSITELTWTVNTTFKIFASKSWPLGNGGIPWMPRQYNLNGLNPPIVTADSSYRLYTACNVFTTANLGGPIETSVQGPYAIDFGGDLGNQYALVQTYKWGPGYANMEVNYYVQDYGHVQWELHNLSAATGLYSLVQTSAFNQFVIGPMSAISFPCGVPVI